MQHLGIFLFSGFQKKFILFTPMHAVLATNTFLFPYIRLTII